MKVNIAWLFRFEFCLCGDVFYHTPDRYESSLVSLSAGLGIGLPISGGGMRASHINLAIITDLGSLGVRLSSLML